MNNNFEIIIDTNTAEELINRYDLLSIPCKISASIYEIFMKPYLQAGRDILIITSSAISYHQAIIAKEAVLKDNPDRTIDILQVKVDNNSLINIITEISELRYEGKTIHEVYSYYKAIAENVNYYLTNNYTPSNTLKSFTFSLLKFASFKHRISY